MSNGAAGCGYEYTDLRQRCSHLSRLDDGFECLKFRTQLTTHRITGHPFRCEECTKDADKHVESSLARARQDRDLKVRGGIR